MFLKITYEGKYVSLEETMGLSLLNMQGKITNYTVLTKNSIIKLRHSKKIGRYYYNKFSIGIWKLYNEDGYLIETIDKDFPYKNYPWEKVERFITEELKLNLFDKDVEVNRYIDEEVNLPIWYITWRTDSTEVFSIKINALTGKVISKEINKVRE